MEIGRLCGKMNDDFKLTDGTDLPLNSTFTATIARSGDEWVVTAFHTSVNAFENPVMRSGFEEDGANCRLGRNRRRGCAWASTGKALSPQKK